MIRWLSIVIALCTVSYAGSVHIGVMTGPTGMGIVKLVHDGLLGKTQNEYTYDLRQSAAAFVEPMKDGTLNIAAVPSNVAAQVYNSANKAVEVLAINTLGVTYIIESNPNEQRKLQLEDLEGRTIYYSGANAVPEYTLKILLQKANINAELVSKSTPDEVLEVMKNSNTIVMLPQPFVTKAVNQYKLDLSNAIDCNKEWEKRVSVGGIITGVVLAQKSYVNEHKEEVKTFLKEYLDSTRFVNDALDESAELVGHLGIVVSKMAKMAIPYCNIVCITGTEMRDRLDDFYRTLEKFSTSSIGKLPEEDFYFDGDDDN